MSLWIDILNATSAGDDDTADRMLNFSLLSALRYPSAVAESTVCSYDGPVAKAVLNYIRGLRETPEHSLGISRSEDLIDFVVEEIISKIRRTVRLVQFCRLYPELDIEGVAKLFDGWDGLKLGVENRIQWVAQHLYSMSQTGVSLPATSSAVAEARGRNFEAVYGFEERALVKGWRVGGSWQAFKKQEEISSDYFCVENSNPDEGAASEAFDFGVIQESKLAPLSSVISTDKSFEIREAAIRITRNLGDLLEDMHTKKSADGFKPIAWHSAWWNISDYWNALPLKLELKDPCCDTDDQLATHISENYSEVQKVNRLNIYRRRTKLETACSDSILEELKEWSER